MLPQGSSQGKFRMPRLNNPTGEPPNASLALGTMAERALPLLGQQAEPRGLAGALTALKSSKANSRGQHCPRRAGDGPGLCADHARGFGSLGNCQLLTGHILECLCVPEPWQGHRQLRFLKGRRAGGGKVIPLPFVLQLEFQPRDRLGGILV